MRYAARAMATVILKRGRAKPLWHGHPWVFSEAIARVEGDAEDGDAVVVQDAEGHLVGHGFLSARSQIRVRLLVGDDRGERLDDELLVAHGLAVACDVGVRQKTGFYFDQRENRRVVAGLARGRRVLDGYSYTGGFALHAARAGATRVVAVEASERAARLASENAARNG